MLASQPAKSELNSQRTGPAGKTRLLIIDDRATVRQALEERLGHAPEIELVGSVASTAEGLDAVQALAPDVVLLEIKLVDGSGLEACRHILQVAPATHVIILTSYMDDAERQAAFQAGASSYVLKDIDSQRLIRAIAAIHRSNARE
jgi:two-component system response regulator DevR